MKIHRLFSLLLLLAAAAHADALKEHLSVFFDMEVQDSVVALEQKSPTLLWITVADPATGATRVLKEEVGAKPMQKLLIESNDKGLKTIYMTSADDAGAAPDTPADATDAKADEPVKSIYADAPKTAVAEPKHQEPARPASASSLSGQRKNRMWYMTYQTIASTYVYGIALPFAYDNVGTKTRIATPMIVAPLAFGANFFFAKDRPFEDAHLKGTTYLSIASLYASHALPFSVMDWDSNPYRAVSYLSMAAYPLGVWGGYKLGDKYVDRPGRIDTQQKFALSLGALGFFTPFIYFEDFEGNGETIVRLGMGQSLALAAGGHFIADQYRQGENIPDGVNTGILHHSVLGAAVGLEIAALSDASTVRPWLGAAILGGTLGFVEGLYWYRDSYDSKERGLYNSLGMAAGTLMGAGIAFLATDDNDSDYRMKTMWTSMLVGGTWVGYLAINLLTDGMEDRGAAKPDSWTDRLAVNLIPMPEPVVRDKEMYLRYRVQGMTYRF